MEEKTKNEEEQEVSNVEETKIEEKQTLKQKVVEVLKECGETNLKDLYVKVHKSGSAVRATIYHSIKKEERIFVKTGKGKYALNADK